MNLVIRQTAAGRFYGVKIVTESTTIDLGLMEKADLWALKVAIDAEIEGALPCEYVEEMSR